MARGAHDKSFDTEKSNPAGFHCGNRITTAGRLMTNRPSWSSSWKEAQTTRCLRAPRKALQRADWSFGAPYVL